MAIKGNELAKQSEFLKAIEKFTEAMKYDPNDPRYLEPLAQSILAFISISSKNTKKDYTEIVPIVTTSLIYFKSETFVLNFIKYNLKL